MLEIQGLEVHFVGNVVDREVLKCSFFGKRVRFVQVLGGYSIREQMYVFFFLLRVCVLFLTSTLTLTNQDNSFFLLFLLLLCKL